MWVEGMRCRDKGGGQEREGEISEAGRFCQKQIIFISLLFVLAKIFH